MQQVLAECYGVCKLNKLLIFEDLNVKGYNCLSVKHGLDIDGAELVLSKAATFHAICAVLNEEYPSIFDNFKYGKVIVIQ